MALTNTTTLQELLPQIVQEAIFVASEKSIAKGLVRNYTLPLQQGKTVTVPIYNKVTADSLTEATAPTAVAIDTDGATKLVREKFKTRKDFITFMKTYNQTMYKDFVSIVDDHKKTFAADKKLPSSGAESAIKNAGTAYTEAEKSIY